MKNKQTEQRRGWYRRLLRRLPALGLVGAMGVWSGPVLAQDTGDSTVPRTYLNKPLIHLPIEIDNSFRSQITGLALYMKEGASGAWALKDKAAPMQTSFTFRAGRDGEYWFRIVAVDQQGKSHPDDLSKDPQDSVVVVVDSQPPILDIALQGAAPEGQYVQVETRDVNGDLSKLRFSYQTRDQVWRALDAVPNQPNTFCVPAQAALTGFIRVTTADMAGNPAARTLNLNELAVAPVRTAKTSPSAPLPQAVAQETPLAVSPPQVTRSVPAPSVLGTEPVLAPVPRLTEQASVTDPKEIPFQPQPVNSSPTQRLTPSSVPAGVVITQGPLLDPQGSRLTIVNEPAVPTNDVQTISSGTMSSRSAPANTIQLVGSPQVFLNFALENVGASGVGKVETWATRDQGKSWQKVAEHGQSKNPVEVHLSGEGLFGLKLVVSNGRGFGAQPPQAGDPADWWLEVDTTKPKANITGIRSGSPQDAGAITILWNAEDKNLNVEPIDLYFAANREGPWTLIAKGMKNTGQHRWTPPQEAGSQAFIRLIARDKVGNVTLSETVQPVPLDDLSRPRVRVLGISTTSPSQATTTGAIQPQASPGAILSVQTTNTPVNRQPANHSISTLGVDVK